VLLDLTPFSITTRAGLKYFPHHWVPGVACTRETRVCRRGENAQVSAYRDPWHPAEPAGLNISACSVAVHNAAMPTPPKPRHTILVVDDEPDVVKSVQDLLRYDYRVLGATSAAEGLKIMETNEVHCVMTDQRMPETTGVEFLTHVRGEHPDAVRLLFTGYADIRAVIEAINQGNVFRYLTKPWDPDELQAVIRQACERYDMLVERQGLLTKLRDQNAELERANTELMQSNQLKQAFIQVASHELRTPLTILLGLSHLATKAAKGQEPLAGWLGRIESSGRRLQSLVDQIISMLVANQFDRPLERADTNLTELLNSAADDVRPFVELRGQTLELELAPDLGSVSVEAPRIRDALNHLLLNAIKFTPDGGRISLASARSSDGGVTIRVSDTGAGIDAAARENLFTPFFTGFDVSHHSSGQFEHGRKGLGLGLSVVKAFVEFHGGTINVDTEVGRGTTFTVWLPGAP
jgi:signal transduction histidine kinase